MKLKQMLSVISALAVFSMTAVTASAETDSAPAENTEPIRLTDSVLDYDISDIAENAEGIMVVESESVPDKNERATSLTEK